MSAEARAELEVTRDVRGAAWLLVQWLGEHERAGRRPEMTAYWLADATAYVCKHHANPKSVSIRLNPEGRSIVACGIIAATIDEVRIEGTLVV